MKELKKLSAICLFMTTNAAFAGGLLTNTNQNIAFNRMMSREASIGIDGVYSNPAGVAFMKEGWHLSLNWQMAKQTRTIENSYQPFSLNKDNRSESRKFKGDAFAPVLPSIQAAYNKGKWSFQGNFALSGGGGKCTFENGLGSFERIVANAAAILPQVAAGLDQIAQSPSVLGQSIGMTEMFPQNSEYTLNTYMKGRQYYFGLSLGAAYKVNEKLSAFAGVRAVYATCNYYGYVRDITINGTQLSTLLGGEGRGDIELNCDQTGIGFTPILSVHYRPNKHWNFTARYEFKTRMRLKNEAVNKTPDMATLGTTLSTMINAGISQKLTAAGYPEATAAAVAANATTAIMTQASGTLSDLSGTLTEKIDNAIGEYVDGKKIPADIPALLTLGVGYSPIEQLRINAGFHYFFDKDARSHDDRQRLLDGGTVEVNAGVEYDINKLFTVSAGWQNTHYGLSDEYMDDKSFVVNSNSIGLGACVHISDNLDFNLAYFTTLYGHKKTTEADDITSMPFNCNYHRTNRVLGVGLDISF